MTIAPTVKRVLKPGEAAEYIGVPANTLASWRYLDRGDGAGRSPKWIKSKNGLVQRCIGYRVEALDAWLDERESSQ